VAAQLKTMSFYEVKEQLEYIKNLVELKKTADFNISVQIARDYFEEFFNHKILNMLSLFPKDYKDWHGNPFWSGQKRAPDAATFDPSDPLH
jgi:ubiquitin-activating enzyme E1